MRSDGYPVASLSREIEFSSGTVYRYLDVPHYLHSTLMVPNSHAQFPADYIRNAGFDFVRVS